MERVLYLLKEERITPKMHSKNIVYNIAFDILEHYCKFIIHKIKKKRRMIVKNEKNQKKKK